MRERPGVCFWRCAVAATIAVLWVPLAAAAPAGIGFNGLLADGGSFSGYVLYGDEDIEGVSETTPGGVPDLGRYRGGIWQVDILGGSTTASAQLSNLLGGRAPVETRETPPLISVLALGPGAGELPRLELLFEASPTYDADVQPTVADIVGFYFSFTIGSKTVFSRYQDPFGVSSVVTAIDFFDATHLYNPVPLPAAAWLMGGALAGLFAPVTRRRHGTAIAGPAV